MHITFSNLKGILIYKFFCFGDGNESDFCDECGDGYGDGYNNENDNENGNGIGDGDCDGFEFRDGDGYGDGYNFRDGDGFGDGVGYGLCIGGGELKHHVLFFEGK